MILHLISVILIAIGVSVLLFGAAFGICHIIDRISEERERRRKLEQQFRTLLTRIADNSEPKA